MKAIIFYILFLLPFLVCGQKFNYESFICYGDFYLDKILRQGSQQYQFYGSIKSAKYSDFNSEGKLSGHPIKYNYDSLRNINKITNYNPTNGEEWCREFLFRSHFGVDPILKASYQMVDGQEVNKQVSEIDTVLKRIIYNGFNDKGKLDHTDTIFYIRNYWPIEIRRYRHWNGEYSIQRISYLENGKPFKNVILKKSKSDGVYHKFNESGKPWYNLKIDMEEFDLIPIDYNDSTKVKYSEFKWKSEKDFELVDNMNYSVNFNFQEKKLTKIKNNEIDTYIFNKDLLLIKYTSVEEKDDYHYEVNYIYNKNLDPIEEIYKMENHLWKRTHYIYVYDHMNNWIEKKTIENGKLVYVIKREIEYY